MLARRINTTRAQPSLLQLSSLRAPALQLRFKSSGGPPKAKRPAYRQKPPPPPPPKPMGAGLLRGAGLFRGLRQGLGQGLGRLRALVGRPQVRWSDVAIAVCALITLYNVTSAFVNGKQDDNNEADADAAAASPPPYASRVEMLQAARQIAELLGDDKVSHDDAVLEHHGHSDWSTANSPMRAVAVVYPTCTDDVVAVARVCTRHRVPMVPFGAGSSVEGNFAQPYSGIVLDFTRMDKVVAFHPDDMDVVVQPGVNWVALNEQVAAEGLFFPVDPSPTATVGGMVATNCSGTNAMRYGTMKDWVVNLTVVLPDGRVVKTRRRPRKTSAGYNLTGLFVGAEGTLGVVTEATLKLAPVPAATSVAVVPLPDVATAARAATALVRAGVPLGALELMDEVQMRLLNEHGSEAVRRRGAWPEQPTLFLKFSGTPDGIQGDARRAGEIIKGIAGPKVPVRFAKTKQDEHDLWAARKEALFTMVATRAPGTVLWSTDAAVPLSRLAEMIEASKQECGALGIFATVIGHVGDGNFHVAMLYDPRDAALTDKVRQVVHNMTGRALAMEGTVSGEHGIGMGKKDGLVEELGPDAVGLMQTFKQAVDPLWIMNPGKVFDPPGKLPPGDQAKK